MQVFVHCTWLIKYSFWYGLNCSSTVCLSKISCRGSVLQLYIYVWCIFMFTLQIHKVWPDSTANKNYRKSRKQTGTWGRVWQVRAFISYLLSWKNLSGYIQRWHILEMNTQYLICKQIGIWMLLIII